MLKKNLIPYYNLMLGGIMAFVSMNSSAANVFVTAEFTGMTVSTSPDVYNGYVCVNS